MIRIFPIETNNVANKIMLVMNLDPCQDDAHLRTKKQQIGYFDTELFLLVDNQLNVRKPQNQLVCAFYSI